MDVSLAEDMETSDWLKWSVIAGAVRTAESTNH